MKSLNDWSASGGDGSSRTALRLFVLVLALTLCFGLQAFTQRAIQHTPNFHQSTTLLSCCVPLSALLMGVFRGWLFVGTPPLAPKRAHFFNGVLLFIAFTLSAQAGAYLSTTIFLVLKSVKILPTMLIASLWLRKRFSLLDWAAGLVSAAGMGLCLEVKGGLDDMRWRWLGAICMVGALAFDGASANAQEAIMRQFGAPREELALYSYGVASLASIAYGLVWRGDLGVGVQALLSNPPLATLFLAYAAASCGATACTLDLIADFGASSFMFISALAKALVTVASMLSEWREGGGSNPVSAHQLTGITLVFLAAALAAYARSRAEAEGGGGGVDGGQGLTSTTPLNLAPSSGATEEGGKGGPGGETLPPIRAPPSKPDPGSGGEGGGEAERGGAGSSTTAAAAAFGASVQSIGITPRTYGMELGLGGGQQGLRRRRGGGERGEEGEGGATPFTQQPHSSPSGAGKQHRGSTGGGGGGTAPQQLPSSPSLPFRETLSTALTLVSAAGMGIERPLPQAEVLSPVALARSRSHSLESVRG